MTAASLGADQVTLLIKFDGTLHDKVALVVAWHCLEVSKSLLDYLVYVQHPYDTQRVLFDAYGLFFSKSFVDAFALAEDTDVRAACADVEETFRRVCDWVCLDSIVPIPTPKAQYLDTLKEALELQTRLLAVAGGELRT